MVWAGGRGEEGGSYLPPKPRTSLRFGFAPPPIFSKKMTRNRNNKSQKQKNKKYEKMRNQTEKKWAKGRRGFTRQPESQNVHV